MEPTKITEDATPKRTRSVQTKAQLKGTPQSPNTTPKTEEREDETALQLCVLDGDLPDIDLLMGDMMSD